MQGFERADRQEQIAALCTGHDYAKPGKPKIDWDDPAAKDGLVSALVNDATALVGAFQDAELDETAASAVALLALAAGQDLTCDMFGGLDGGRLADLRVLTRVRRMCVLIWAAEPPGYPWWMGCLPDGLSGARTSWASAARLLPLAALSRLECHTCRA